MLNLTDAIIQRIKFNLILVKNNDTLNLMTILLDQKYSIKNEGKILFIDKILNFHINCYSKYDFF